MKNPQKVGVLFWEQKSFALMGIISEDTIERWIIPYLPVGKRGFATTAPLHEVIECIFIV
jgi:hypothetical protein